jgi:pyridoxal phosphate enzyme (YggS family)
MMTLSAATALLPDDDIAGRLAAVRARVARAAVRAGRDPGGITLVAVGKGFGVEHIRAAVAAGQRDLGESKAQELTAKAGALDAGVRWHFVGRLQRNKVAEVVGRVHLVHSVDRLPLARALATQARRVGTVQRVLLQVNTAGDPAKAGCAPAEAADLLAEVRSLDGLDCTGLMTVPAFGQDPRPAFGQLRALCDRLGLAELSMGMSDDVEIAVEEGATIVRIGRAIFGQRPAA